MGVSALGPSRGLIGEFYKVLSQDLGASWIPSLSMLFPSSQATETYRWLGMVPQMRQWIGGRQAKGFFDNSYSISNQKYEATLEVLKEDLDRDGTGQTRIRIAELASRANSHWASLISTLIENGESTTCYDGQYFFDTDHAEGNNSTSQSNDLSINISSLPAAVSGSTTNPSPQEMTLVILQCIETILGFKDNENEPMNENASNFLVMVPISLLGAASAAVNNMTFGGGETNQLKSFVTGSGFNLTLAANARLTWTEQISVFRTDGRVKPFIRQEESPITVSALAEGSELEFTDDMHQYGVRAIRNVGYGFWQHACLATMV